MKIACVYHSIDLDGWMSAAIIKHWFNNQSKEVIESNSRGSKYTMDFIDYTYGQDVLDLSEYDRVIMCDISFPNIAMQILSERGRNFIWIDHHISAIKDNKELLIDSGIRDSKFAACELTWKYFFPNDPMPEIVRLLGRYDCFGHKGTDEEKAVLEFQYGARSVISNYEEAYQYLLMELTSDPIHSRETILRLYMKGSIIYSYLCLQAVAEYASGVPIELEETLQDNIVVKRKCILINKNRFNPINFGIDYNKDGYECCVCFNYNSHGTWGASIYNDNGEVDCSNIAKKFGGGGHKGASGFRINDINVFLNNYKCK